MGLQIKIEIHLKYINFIKFKPKKSGKCIWKTCWKISIWIIVVKKLNFQLDYNKHMLDRQYFLLKKP